MSDPLRENLEQAIRNLRAAERNLWLSIGIMGGAFIVWLLAGLLIR